ncbi:MAG: DUF2284 domain-containing protein [archaeon]|nr:DUF2284 domain-containing protein [archaeon]
MGITVKDKVMDDHMLDGRICLLKKLCKDISNSNLFVDVVKPNIILNSIRKNREICKTNRCGNYGRNLTCPPFLGDADVCISEISRYNIADVLTQTFEDVDFRNKSYVKKIIGGFQDTCRSVMTDMRRNGFDVIALSVGGCNYCERCSALDDKKCRYPEMRIFSISGYGIDMAEYIRDIGGDFTFRDGEITLYCIFLTKNGSALT